MRRNALLPHGKPGIRSFVWGVEGQYNIILGHTELYQLTGEPSLRAVLLNPDLPVADVNVQQTLIHTMQSLPAQEENLIMIPRRIVERLHFHAGAGWIALRIALQQLLYMASLRSSFPIS